MLAKLRSGQSYFLSYFDRLTQDPFYVIVLCCLTPLSTIFKFYRGGQFSFIGRGNRAILKKPPTCHKSGTDHLTCRGVWGVMVFCFVQNCFSDNTRVRILFFFVAQSAIFFLQNSTLGYMTKALNHITFFSSTKIRIFFSATLGIRIFF